MEGEHPLGLEHEPLEIDEHPLHTAIKNGEEVQARILLEDGADPNQSDMEGRNALHVATQFGCSLPLFHRILVRIHDVNRVTIYENTALQLAARWGRFDFLIPLLDRPEIDPNMRDNEGCSALLETIIYQHIHMLVLLMKRPYIDINIMDEMGRTPIHHAIYSNRIVLVQQLLSDYKIDCTIEAYDWGTPMNLAESRGYDDCKKLLTDHEIWKVDTLEKYSDEQAPVCVALKAEDEPASWLLMVDGANPNDIYLIQDGYENGWNALHMAIKYGCIPELFDRILENIYYVNAVTNDLYKRTASHLAIFHDKQPMLKKMLKHLGFNYRSTDLYGRTPIEYAKQLKRNRCVEILINGEREQEDRKVIIRNNYVFLVPNLMSARTRRSEEAIWYFLDTGENPNEVDRQGWNALHWASTYGCSIPLFKRILDKIKNVNAKTAHRPYGFGRTALMFAVSNDWMDMVILLMTHPKINIHEQDDGGQTALHKAVSYKRLDILQLLLDDDRIVTTITDIDGKTPLKYAKDIGHFECVRILEEHARILKERSAKVSELLSLEHQCTLRF